MKTKCWRGNEQPRHRTHYLDASTRSEGGEDGGGCTVESDGPVVDIDAAMSVYGAVDALKAEEVIVNIGGGDGLRETEDDTDIDDRVVLGVDNMACSGSEYDIGSEWTT